LVGEITVDTDLDTLRVHDGSTAGGHRLAKFSDVNTQENIEDSVNDLLVGGTGVTLTYDDAAGTLTIDGQTGDITGVTAGDGLSGGGTSGTVSLALDLNELTAAAVDVAADSIALIDGGDSSSKKESIADLASAMAGTGITATAGVLSATTGDITSVVAGASLSGGGTSGDVTLAFDGSAVAQSIIPSADVTYDLGSSSKQWRDVYVGPGSLYVNGQKVLEDNSGTITVSADVNQNLGLITSGSGDVELNASGTGVINVQSAMTFDSGQVLTGTGGLTMGSNVNANSNQVNNLPAPTQASDATNKTYVDGTSYITGGDGIDNNSSTIAVDSTVVRTTGTQTVGGNKTFSNDIVIDGNFTVSGTTTTINTETLLLEDNIITLNAGTSGAPSENAGITIDRGSSADVNFQYNETSDKWQFTNDGSSYVNLATDTDSLTEGSTNLYFTNARADARAVSSFDTKLAAADTNDLSEGSNLYYTNERVDDRVGAIMSGAGNISVTYDDSAGTITVSEALTTTDITEGDNLYYTNSRADARITAALIDEDNMSSNSATRLPSQQSVKAYVDAQVDTADALSELSGDSDDITEGSTNVFFTDARADARISAALIDEDNMASNSATRLPSQQSVKAYVDAQVDTADALSELSGDSDDVSEGSTNLYFTNARADARISAASTSDLSEGTNQYFTNARADARVNAVVTNSFVDALNVDADTLDGISSASFLRSDANDTHSGTITPNADNSLDLGSGSLRYNQVFAVTFEGTATSAKYADLAEKYTTDEEIEAGTVVCFGGEAELTSCSAECDHRVAGVISTDPAYMMNSDGEGQYLALTGRVPTKVTGPVAKGDLLVSSSTKGHATVDNNAQAGRIIGKAVGSSDGGEAVIEVLVNMM
jgi:hypothetical protein